MSDYLLDNTASQSAGRFEALTWTYDEASKRALSSTGVGSGWRCWEVGGGGGSIAAWLADRVAPEGTVLVTDIEPKWMQDLAGQARLAVRQHDVVHDALPVGAFDLIHARLVLLHLPQRHTVIDRLISCLRPGGWLVAEDFDCEDLSVLAEPAQGSSEVFEAVHGAFLRLLRARGADPSWGQSLPAALREHGLHEVSSTVHMQAWRGGSAGIALHWANVEQLVDRLRGEGVDQRDLVIFEALLGNPEFIVQSYPLVSAVGRKAGPAH